jgi:hypothetical protein
MDEFEAGEVGGCDLLEIPTRAGNIPVAIDDQGTIYLSGDLHPAGAQFAAVEALNQGIPWVQHGAVQVLYPINWLAAAAMGAKDSQRIVAIGMIERYVRGGNH